MHRRMCGRISNGHTQVMMILGNNFEAFGFTEIETCLKIRLLAGTVPHH